MACEGFPKETVAFLRAIDCNNNKTWFEDHRTDYENYWLDPAREFVDAVSARLQKIAPVAAAPRVTKWKPAMRSSAPTDFAQASIRG